MTNLWQINNIKSPTIGRYGKKLILNSGGIPQKQYNRWPVLTVTLFNWQSAICFTNIWKYSRHRETREKYTETAQSVSLQYEPLHGPDELAVFLSGSVGELQSLRVWAWGTGLGNIMMPNHSWHKHPQKHRAGLKTHLSTEELSSDGFTWCSKYSNEWKKEKKSCFWQLDFLEN